MKTCANGTMHTGINLICSTCDKPTCQSKAPDTGVGCTQDLFHEGQHYNYFSLNGLGTKTGPWDDPDYIPVKPTDEEIEEAKLWQKEMNELHEAAERENDREREKFYYE